ncbi:MAG TPA: hypothetical protein VFK39_11045 [Gemmatimonadaceae bacterium]|nr:hypothetical protein [Gemmatimonadaceae bacterium]
MKLNESPSKNRHAATVTALATATMIALSGSVFVAAPARAQTAASGAAAGARPAAPKSGQELLGRMHDQWAKGTPWFNTLIFTQRTTVVRQDGTKDVSTWYESVLAPDRLRIDFGDPSEGNGVVYTADSVYVIRGGKLARKAGDGNPFLPFVIGVYTQPLERTLAQLQPLGIDMSRVRSDSWAGRPVYVVGARDASDTSSAQFWVDADRLILLRMVLAPAAEAGARSEPLDIHLDDYVEVGGGWLATKVVMYAAGVARQTEEYSDWKAGVELSPDFFVAEKWSAVPHWASSKR